MLEIMGKSLIVVQILLLLIITIKIFTNKNRSLKTIGRWIELCFFPIFLLGISVSVMRVFKDTETTNQVQSINLIILGLTAMAILWYGLMMYIINSAKERGNRKLKEIQDKNLLDKYEQDMDNFRYINERNKEFKNHIERIDTMAKNGEYDKMQDYIGEVSHGFMEGANQIDTGNAYVNVVLNEKYKQAVSEGITFVMEINNLSRLTLSDKDIVILLSNVLNNALEACRKCTEDKYIKFKCVMNGEKFVLSVKNSMNGDVSYENGRIVSTKDNARREHGVGLKNIVETVERNEGLYDISTSEREFWISIVIFLE